MDTWKAACDSGESATIQIPKGNYWMGPANFTGPCKNVPSIVMNLEARVQKLSYIQLTCKHRLK